MPRVPKMAAHKYTLEERDVLLEQNPKRAQIHRIKFLVFLPLLTVSFLFYVVPSMQCPIDGVPECRKHSAIVAH